MRILNPVLADKLCLLHVKSYGRPLFVTAMEEFIPELPQVEARSGAPWLWQVRRFQDDCVVVLREIRGQRLQGGRYPNW